MGVIFSREELIEFNEKMLGRGMPTQHDGVGYNKADYGACATYYYGLSDSQYADLSKRLIKYCNTQLGIDKEDMKATEGYYRLLADSSDRENGVSVRVIDKDVMLSFKYNEDFIKVIKKQPKRKYDKDCKKWIVPMERAVEALLNLQKAGADTENAIRFIRSISEEGIVS